MNQAWHCSQFTEDNPCNLPAVFRYTWPGKDEAGICAVHASALTKIAAVMGLRIQLIALGPTDE